MKKELSIAQIGHKFIGKAHAYAYSNAGFFFDLPVTLRKRLLCGIGDDLGDIAAQWGYEKHTQNWKEAVADPDIDIVDICAPSKIHKEIALEAAKQGKHVFCEKPMAIATQGCDRMLRAWVESGKQFMIGFNMRYMSIFRVMKDAVDSGAIGDVKVVWVRHFVGHGGDWYYHDWHGASRHSTGLLLQKASHDIDMIHWITGRYTTTSSKH